MIITLVDCVNVLYCRKGVRAFFDKYNLDYNDFRKNGIDSAILAKLNDSMANKVIEAKLSGKL